MRKRINIFDALLDFTEILILATTVFAVVYVFIGQLLEVYGGSMIPNFIDGERLIAEKVSIKYKPLTRGEVVVFQDPNSTIRRLLIKRVVGLPGEAIKLSNGLVYINGEKLDEPYLDSNVPTNVLKNGLIKENEEYPIAQNTYILLGDNREQSTDSRYFGSVKKDSIIGRVFLIYYPINKIRLVEN